MKLLAIGATVALLASASQADATTIYGIDLSGRLVTFDSSTPGTISSTTTLSGIVGSAILGIDFRPATGQLYALGGNSTLYTVDITSGVATAVGSGGLPLNGSNFAFGFNPTVDRIRVVSDSGQNLRLNPATGGVAATDTAYTYTDTTAAPAITAVGYTNSFAGATTTTLYGIDYARDTLVLIGNPNGGVATTVGSLGFDIGADASFDITTGGLAYLSSGFGFYSVNLTTGAATLLGADAGLRNIAVTPTAVPEPGTWMMMIAGFGTLGASLRYRRRPRVVFVRARARS